MVYESQECENQLKIHQFSGLAGKHQPEFLVYSEIYSIETTSFDGTVKMTHYMKGTTKVDNLSWVNNLCSDLLVQRSMPIHEHDSRALSTPDAKRQLMIAKKLAEARSPKDKKSVSLISYTDETIKVYSQVYLGKHLWPLSIEQLPLSQLKAQYTVNGQVSLQYYSFFAYLLLKGEIFPDFKNLSKKFSDNPSCVLDDTNLTPKVTRVLGNLAKFNIDSKDKLRSMWKDVNPQFLLDCLVLWID